MKMTDELIQEISTKLEKWEFVHKTTNGIHNWVNNALKEGIEIKGDKINPWVFSDDMERVYGLENTGFQTIDAVKCLEELFGGTKQEEKLQDPPDVPEQNGSSFAVVPEYLTKEIVAKHPGTIPALISMQKTASHYVKERPGSKGSTLKYVDTGYVTVALNYAALMDWDFEVVETREDQVGDKIHYTVLGKLTIRTTEGKEISKTQYGAQVLKAGMEVGDALKGAASDSLKKCASMLGVAADVYAGGL